MRTILLVEDHAESRSSLAWVLEKNGYAVRQASNGRAALAAARREKLHALILDLKLPDMEGSAVLDAVLEQHPGLPAIVVTGFGTVDTAVEAMKTRGHGLPDQADRDREPPRDPGPGDRAGERERRGGDAPVAGDRGDGPARDRRALAGDARAVRHGQEAGPAPVRPCSSSGRAGPERS